MVLPVSPATGGVRSSETASWRDEETIKFKKPGNLACTLWESTLLFYCITGPSFYHNTPLNYVVAIPDMRCASQSDASHYFSSSGEQALPRTDLPHRFCTNSMKTFNRKYPIFSALLVKRIGC
jgi:hypothetical protein